MNNLLITVIMLNNQIQENLNVDMGIKSGKCCMKSILNVYGTTTLGAVMAVIM